jgi:BirA family biotin operon repressor/biotin-[acetyl-CoA-carboxylase] ligase
MNALDPIDQIQVPGWRVETIGATVSTNQLAAARAESGEPAGWAVIADHQTAGKGRRGNRWEAPPGASLLLSAILRPAAPLQQWPRLAVAAAVAVCRAIEATTSLVPQIKWPNDILIDGRKVAGILLESRAPGNHAPGWVVIGIGINVHSRDFPLGLRYPATSLVLAAGHAPSRVELANALLVALADEAAKASGDGWDGVLRAYAARDALAGHAIRAETNGQVVEGVAAGLDPEGELIVHPSSGPPVILRDAHGITILG